MNHKRKLAGFKASVQDRLNSTWYFEEMDGSWRLWPELSPQSKLNYIAGDAARCDIPFKHFAEAVRQVVPAAALVEAALRMVLHYERELHGLAKLLPDDERTESMPLAHRIKEMLESHPERTDTDRDRDIER